MHNRRIRQSIEESKQTALTQIRTLLQEGALVPSNLITDNFLGELIPGTSLTLLPDWTEVLPTRNMARALIYERLQLTEGGPEAILFDIDDMENFSYIYPENYDNPHKLSKDIISSDPTLCRTLYKPIREESDTEE